MSKQTEWAYDVFVSYSHADEAWVTSELLPRLEEAGLRVCIDFRDFVAGRAALLNMQDAAKQSRHTLLILTPAWVASEWTLYESLLSRTSDPAGLQRRTVPLLLEKCELPEFIGMLTWVDFTRPDRLKIAWTQLLTALGAPPVQRAPETPAREHWDLYHPYAMPPNFTGRLAEREMLNRWLNDDTNHPLLLIRALGGFGKSALSWHWLLHDVDPNRWPRVLWWSFYEGEAGFDSFLQEALRYLSVDPIPSGPRPQADELLRQLRQSSVLLVLDGFERVLRAFSGMNAAYQGDEAARPDDQSSERDCVSPIAEHFLRSVATLPGIRGKVLMTTRLRPRVLEGHGGMLLQGCREIELTAMHPTDAVEFVRAQGIRGTRAEIEQACERYGYHPLSLRLLAGLVVNDLQQPGDIAAAQRLDVSGDLKQRQHHVLEQAYNSLTPHRRNLLSRIACFRSPVDYAALAAAAEHDAQPQPEKPGFLARLFNRSKPKVAADPTHNLDADLQNLISRGLLQHDRKTSKYDLHPIVRRYAYDQLGDDERISAHNQLRDYFAAVPVPERVQHLEELAPVIELYHHMVRAGQYDEAFGIFRVRINKATYYQFGAYQLRIELLRELFPDGEDRLPRLSSELDQAWALNVLANSYGLRGQPRQAILLFERQIAIREKRVDKLNLAIGLANRAIQQIVTGALHIAEVNLRHSIELCHEVKDIYQEGVGHAELGQLLVYRGVWEEAQVELDAALLGFEQEQEVQYQGIVRAYRAQMALLMKDGEIALTTARRALELADETARTRHPFERDYIRAHWLLGAAHRVNGNLTEADQHLTEALTRCRSINAVETEADILLDLAKLRAAQGEREEVLDLAQEALTITERSGYVLQGADVNLFLAQMALEAGDKPTALEYAREARKLATCDGPPDYTYKVAYEEAGRLLAELGEPPQDDSNG